MSGGDAGFMVRDGVELRWKRSALPIAVILHPSAAALEPEIVAVTNGFNRGLNINCFLRPTTILSPALEAAFTRPDRRPFIRSTVLVMGDGVIENLRHLGSSDLRYDKRTGEIFNVIVTLPPRLEAIEALGGGGEDGIGQQLLYQAGLHEFGHVLGLEHDTDLGSIMHPQVRPDAYKLLPGDVGRLRGAYDTLPW